MKKYKVTETTTHYVVAPQKAEEIETLHLASGHVVHIMQGPIIVNKKCLIEPVTAE